MIAPARKKVAAGETWLAQLAPGAVALAFEVDEVTKATVVLKRVADLAYRPNATTEPVRYARHEIIFLEKL